MANAAESAQMALRDLTPNQMRFALMCFWVKDPTSFWKAVQAGQQERQMAGEVHKADGGDTMAAPVFPIHARYAYPDAGWELDRNRAADLLTLGEVYTVRTLLVGGSTSYLTLDGVDGRFNTVNFAPVGDDDA